MLVTLGTNPRGKNHDPSDPVDLIVDCHEKIRRFSALAVRLATAEAAPAEVSEVAARVHRYFTVAMPLHVADEDDSLRPRLLSAHPNAAVVDALGTMAREHVEADDLLLELAPTWEALKEDPTRRAGFGAELARASTHLEELMRKHLTLEEGVILPSIRALLPPEAQAEVVREMRARRERR